MRGFYVVKNPLAKPNMSINEGFSTIEGFQCTIEMNSRFLLAVLLFQVHWNPSIVDPSIVENPSLIDMLGLTNGFFTT